MSTQDFLQACLAILVEVFAACKTSCSFAWVLEGVAVCGLAVASNESGSTTSTWDSLAVRWLVRVWGWSASVASRPCLDRCLLLALAPAVVVQAISNPLPIYLGLSATESEISKSNYMKKKFGCCSTWLFKVPGCPDSDPWTAKFWETNSLTRISMVTTSGASYLHAVA
jgi:hypothetical protein